MKNPIYYCTVEGEVEEPPKILKKGIKRKIKTFKIKTTAVLKDGKIVNNFKNSIVLKETIDFSRHAEVRLTKVTKINKNPIGFTSY
jgi:hypothetical protein